MVRPEKDKEYSELQTKGYVANSDEKAELSKLLLKHIGTRKFDSFLDIGPGEGIVTCAIAASAKRVTCVEPQQEYCGMLVHALPDARIINKQIYDADFSPKSFDLILISHVLYYIQMYRWREAFDRAWDWLHPGGQLIIALTCPDSDWFRTVIGLSKHLGIVADFSYFNPEILFSDANWKADKIIHHDSYFKYEGDGDNLIDLILYHVMVLPRELVTDRLRKLAREFIDKNRMCSHMKNRSIVGIWNKP